MSDLIDRQAAIDALIDALAWTWSGTWSEKAAIDAIKNMPSVDAVEVKHGRWEKTEESPMRPYMCSQCGALFDLDTLLGIPTWRWCPKCGAKMEVDDDCN